MKEIYIGGILLTRENYLSLRKVYRQALREKKIELNWDGQSWLVSYIHYVLEAMEGYSIIKSVMKEPDPDD